VVREHDDENGWETWSFDNKRVRKKYHRSHCEITDKILFEFANNNGYNLQIFFGRDLPSIVYDYTRQTITDILVDHCQQELNRKKHESRNIELRELIDTSKWSESECSDIFKTFGFRQWYSPSTQWRFGFDFDNHDDNDNNNDHADGDPDERQDLNVHHSRKSYIYDMLVSEMHDNSDIVHEDESQWFWSIHKIDPKDWHPFLVYDIDDCGHTQMMINLNSSSQYYRKILVFNGEELEDTAIYDTVLEALVGHDILYHIVMNCR
jgi:hypothetical protein